MTLIQTAALVNPYLYATGALNIFIYELTGSAVYTIDVMPGMKVIGIDAVFSSPINVKAGLNIVTDPANISVSVYDGADVDTVNDHELTAFVYAKKGTWAD